MANNLWPMNRRTSKNVPLGVRLLSGVVALVSFISLVVGVALIAGVVFFGGILGLTGVAVISDLMLGLILLAVGFVGLVLADGLRARRVWAWRGALFVTFEGFGFSLWAFVAGDWIALLSVAAWGLLLIYLAAVFRRF